MPGLLWLCGFVVPHQFPVNHEILHIGTETVQQARYEPLFQTVQEAVFIFEHGAFMLPVFCFPVVLVALQLPYTQSRHRA